MNVSDAAYHTGKHYLGGFAALAARMGMSEALLRAKLNTNNPRNKLTLEEAELMVGLSGDLGIVQAFAAEQGCALIALPSEIAPDSDVLDLMMERSEREGDLARTVREALADGVITEREMRAIESAGVDAQGVMINLLVRLKQMVPSAPPTAAGGFEVRS